MIHATISEHVNAPADDVRALYENPDNWASVFAGTIRSARVVRPKADAVVVDVDHGEGHVTNMLRRCHRQRSSVLNSSAATMRPS